MPKRSSSAATSRARRSLQVAEVHAIAAAARPCARGCSHPSPTGAAATARPARPATRTPPLEGASRATAGRRSRASSATLRRLPDASDCRCRRSRADARGHDRRAAVLRCPSASAASTHRAAVLLRRGRVAQRLMRQVTAVADQMPEQDQLCASVQPAPTARPATGARARRASPATDLGDRRPARRRSAPDASRSRAARVRWRVTDAEHRLRADGPDEVGLRSARSAAIRRRPARVGWCRRGRESARDGRRRARPAYRR